MDLWEPCGLSKSLQEIEKDNTMSQVIKRRGGGDFGRKITLKPPAKELFDYLEKLFK